MRRTIKPSSTGCAGASCASKTAGSPRTKSEVTTILDSGKVKFFLGEVLRNFSRNTGMQITAIGTVAITIVLLGLFLFIRAALADAGNRHSSIKSRSRPTFASDATPAQVAAIGHFLAQDPRIASAEFVPKEQGLAELARARTRGSIDTGAAYRKPTAGQVSHQVRDPDDVPAGRGDAFAA